MMSLLELWDLSSADLDVILPVPLQALNEPANEQSRLEAATSSDVTYCSSCSIANDASQCWCIECGCSLLEPAHVRVKPVHEINTGGPENHTRQRKPVYCNERRWSNATFYMWRKPSTLSRTKHSSYNQQSAVPKQPASNLQTLNNVSSMSLLLHLLPSELIVNILSYLSVRDLCNCLMVCKRLYHIAADPVLWKIIQLRGETSDDCLLTVARRRPKGLSLISCTGRPSILTVTHLFTACGTRLKMLTIDACRFGPGSVDMWLNISSQCCPNLTNLTISWSTISDHTIYQLATSFCGLQSLSLLHVSGISSCAVRALLTSQRHSLKDLHLHFHPQPIITKLLPQEPLPLVKEFTFHYGLSPITASTLHQVYLTFPNLVNMTVHSFELTEDKKLLSPFRSLLVHSR